MNHFLLTAILIMLHTLLSPRFDIPEEEAWLLSHQPQGLLEAWNGHFNSLINRLHSSSIAEQLQQQGRRSQLLDHVSHCMLALARVTGCQNNYQQLSRSANNLLKAVVTLTQMLLDLLKTNPTAANILGIIEGVRHAVAFLHSLVDPQRMWQRTFMQ